MSEVQFIGAFPGAIDPRWTEMRGHLLAMHCWEEDWLNQQTDEELTAQHREAHDLSDMYEGSNLYRIAYPHSRVERSSERPRV